MSEEKKPKHKYAARDDVDWVAIKRHWCANKMAITEIEEQYGVSRAAIHKRAKKEGWVRDLSEEIDRATKSKVVQAVAAQVTQEVPPQVTRNQKAAERAAVEAYSDVAAAVDTENRRDVAKALGTQRSLLDELDALTDPRFREVLEEIAESQDTSTPARADKVNELYRYVISLPGRIKMAKELAAAHGVYIPMQRKLFGLDEGKGNTPFEDLLARLGAQAEGG